VQIRAADGGMADPDDGIPLVTQDWLGSLLDADIFGTMPNSCLHSFLA